jgi:dTDP-4-dehydrorhamnose reductase
MAQSGEDNKPALLILGARGFLGSAVSVAAGGSHRIIRADRNRLSQDTDVLVDIADRTQVNSALRKLRPDCVLLLAAISDVDRCEREPEHAWAVNLHGVENVANACAQTGSRLLFTSTGAVFDGRKIGYVESDPVSPVSVYAQTKAAAESVAMDLVPSALVVRASLVLGRCARPATNALVESLRRRWERGEKVRASVNEWRNPVDVRTLATWIMELFANPKARGIVHTGGLQAVSRYEIATALAARLGVDRWLVEPEVESPPGRAHRGPHQHLICNRLPLLCATPIPAIETVFERSLRATAQAGV